MSSTPPSSATATDALVTAAVALGWQLADLMETGAVRHGCQPHSQPDLPSKSDLQPWQRTRIDLDLAGALICRLTPTLKTAGVTIPKVTDAQTCVNGQSTEEFQGAIRGLHGALLQGLHGADQRLGDAYDLGRSLAYMVIKPTSNAATLTGTLNDGGTENTAETTPNQDERRNPAQTLDQGETPNKAETASTVETKAEHQFCEQHVTKIQGRLADLASVLPPNSARAVAISLKLWQDAILNPPPPPRERLIGRLPWPTSQPRALDVGAGDFDGACPRLMIRQGKLWHALLTNQKQGVDMLDLNAYVQAADRLVTRTGDLAISVLKKRWVIVAVALAVVAAVAAGLILFTSASAGQKLTASLITAIGAVGITGAGLRSTMSKAISSVERSLMAVEVDTAIAEAITVLPPAKRATDTPDAVAARDHLDPRGPAEAEVPSRPRRPASRQPERQQRPD